MEEPEIISGCLKNDRNAQRYLFDTFYRRTYHVAMRYLANHHDSEDVLSVSYTRIYKNMDRFEYRGEGSLAKWINTVVIHEAIRFLKRKKAIIFQEDEELLVKNIPMGEANGTIDLEEVRQLLDHMPKGYRMVFNLFAIEGYSHKEIAGILQINENTSRSQLNKARNYIIQKLKKKYSHAVQ